MEVLIKNMKLNEEQKQKICDYIADGLFDAKLKSVVCEDNPDDKLPLVDLLSTGDTIKEGKEEINHIVEQIYFQMDEWDI